MELTQLMHVLRKGTSYSKLNEDGSFSQVLEPPNKHMLKAAGIIELLIAQLDKSISDRMVLQALMSKYPDPVYDPEPIKEIE